MSRSSERQNEAEAAGAVRTPPVASENLASAGQDDEYRAIFDSTIDGLAILDLDGTIVEANAALCQMLRYSRDELIGLNAALLTPPDRLTALTESLQQVLSGGETLRNASDKAMRKDGTLLDVETRGRGFTFKGTLHLLAVVRDVTDRVQAEAQLREREEQYRSVFEAATDGLVIHDAAGAIVEINPAYCRMLGYARDELVGKHVSTLIPPEYHRLIDEGMQSIGDGATPRARVDVLRKDGTHLRVEGHGAAFHFDGRPHYLGISRDITEQLAAEEQLKERGEQYRSIFEATTDGMAIVDVAGRLVEVNPAYCRLLGYSRDELIGMSATSLMHPDQHHLIAEGTETIMAEGGTIYNRAVLVRKDGTLLHIDGSGTAFSYKGEPHILGVVRDVTERLQAEELLRQREEQYGAVFDASTDGLVINDLDTGVIVEANPAFCRMHGYTHEEMVGMHPSTHIHASYHHLFPEYVRTAKSGDTFQTQAVDVRKDGTLFPVEVHGSAFSYKGTPHVLGVVRDITERVQAEEQLREREQQYRGIFESSADGLALYDQRGFLVEANPALCQMLGYSREELIGLHASATVHPDFHHVIAEGLARANRDVPFRSEVLLVRKDGTTFPAGGGATTFSYKGVPHELVVLRDISQRVDAERQIREREAEYRAIFETTNDGLMIANLDGYIVEASPAYCRMFGYTREEVIGLHSTALAAPLSEHTIAESVRTLESADSYHTIAEGLRKDGSTFFAEARATRFLYRGQSHYLSVVQDVTERVRAYDLLEQRVEERTRELSTLLNVSKNVSSTLELRPLLNLVLDQLNEVVRYAGASLSVIDGDQSEIVAFRGRGSAEIAVGLRVPLDHMARLGHMAHVWEAWRRGDAASGPIIIDDVRADTPEGAAYRRSESELLDSSFFYVRSWMAAPLIVGDRLVGMLTLNGDEPNLYTAHHAELAMALARQAAVAMENARLYERAQEVAVLEERQRLSRELHDSVSQALYSIALGARTARAMVDGDESRLADPLDFVLAQAARGLAEMRALLVELRPEALELEGLVTALHRQAEATQVRHGFRVETVLGDEPDVPLPMKEALYRIAQEALHNIVKHAQATTVQLALTCIEGEIALEIRDNGKGFDPADSFPGHLGLSSMRERIERLGGALEIESAAGTGTQVRARLPERDTVVARSTAQQ